MINASVRYRSKRKLFLANERSTSPVCRSLKANETLREFVQIRKPWWRTARSWGKCGNDATGRVAFARPSRGKSVGRRFVVLVFGLWGVAELGDPWDRRCRFAYIRLMFFQVNRRLNYVVVENCAREGAILSHRGRTVPATLPGPTMAWPANRGPYLLGEMLAVNRIKAQGGLQTSRRPRRPRRCFSEISRSKGRRSLP